MYILQMSQSVCFNQSVILRLHWRDVKQFAVHTTIKSTKSDADVGIQGIRKYQEDYKNHVLGVCDARNDRLGQIVKSRVLSALSDLHAANGRYRGNGGHLICKRTLLSKILDFHGESVIALSSPGVANFVGFRSEAAKTLHFIRDDDDDIFSAVDKVASYLIFEDNVLI